MRANHILFRVHAIERMFQRRISVQDIRQILDYAEVIEEYCDDTSYPSQLNRSWDGQAIARCMWWPRIVWKMTRRSLSLPMSRIRRFGVMISEGEDHEVCCVQAGMYQAGYCYITIERDGLTLVIKDVPAQVCENCGEEYIDEVVTTNLMQMAEEVVGEGTEFVVRRYRAA